MTREQQHWMLDLETAGVSDDAILLQIALVRFDPDTGDVFDGMLWVLDPTRQPGRHCDPDTVRWWTQHDNMAEMWSGTHTLRDALRDIGNTLDEGTCVGWARGSMDWRMLEHAFRSHGFPVPFHHYRVFDVRTVQHMQGVPAPTHTDVRERYTTLDPSMTEHNALYDCYRQILHLSRMQRT